MCQVTTGAVFGQTRKKEGENLRDGKAVKLNVGTAIKNIYEGTTLKLRCVHRDGRSDDYALAFGQVLRIDEDDTEMLLLNNEVIAGRPV